MSQRWLPFWILVAGYALFLAYAFPGFMSSDSLLQHSEAQLGTYSNWHPPAMAALWRLVEHAVHGPAAMLILQSAAFVAGAYRLLRRQLAGVPAAACTIGILLFPPVLAAMAVIWKDSQMTGYLLLGASLILDADVRCRIAGVACLALASAMRDNAPAATLPLLLVWNSPRGWWQRVAIGISLWIAITACAFGINRALTTEDRHLWHSAVASQDIVGILHYDQRSDAECEQLLLGTPLKIHHHIARSQLFDPQNWYAVMNGPGRLFDYPEDDAKRAAMLRAWKQLVAESPGDYLHVRLRIFMEVLGLSRKPLFAAVWHTRRESWADPPDVPLRPTQEAIGEALDWIAAHGLVFRPYLYFFGAIGLLVARRRDRWMVALLASALVYELTFFPFAASADVRYSLWLMTIAVIVAILAIAKVVVRRRATK
ncbi:MAG: hypothetical protein JO257_05225 [Deltaproteobacteria bacterium]|nr:hypothetical protein [Deltaproteobacteria bacterium]